MANRAGLPKELTNHAPLERGDVRWAVASAAPAPARPFSASPPAAPRLSITLVQDTKPVYLLSTAYHPLDVVPGKVAGERDATCKLPRPLAEYRQHMQYVRAFSLFMWLMWWRRSIEMTKRSATTPVAGVRAGGGCGCSSGSMTWRWSMPGSLPATESASRPTASRWSSGASWRQLSSATSRAAVKQVPFLPRRSVPRQLRPAFKRRERCCSWEALDQGPWPPPVLQRRCRLRRDSSHCVCMRYL